LDWCVVRKIIVMENKSRTPAFNTDVESEAMKGDSSRLSSMLRSPSYAEAS
jgi:hypothetical protein